MDRYVGDDRRDYPWRIRIYRNGQPGLRYWRPRFNHRLIYWHKWVFVWGRPSGYEMEKYPGFTVWQWLKEWAKDLF